MEHPGDIVRLLMKGKFIGFLELLDNKKVDISEDFRLKLTKPAITYIDSDWNILTISYEEFVNQCRIVWHTLLDIVKNFQQSFTTICGVFSDDDQIIQLNLISSFLIIYGDCAQWTPILMVAANLTKIPFYFIDKEDRLIDSLEIFKSINSKRCWSRVFACQTFRIRELTQVLNNSFPDEKVESKELFSDYSLVYLNNPCQCKSKPKHLFPLIEVSYVINTSGTSKSLSADSCNLNVTSKLIYVTMSSIVANIIDFQKEYKLNENDSVLVCSPYTFDPSICDIFLALASFSQLYLISNSVRNMPSNLMRILTQYSISFITITPALWRRFSNRSLEEYFSIETFPLRFLNFGGELSLPIEQIKSYLEKTTVYNLYGLSEMSTWASIFKLNENLNVLVQANKPYQENKDPLGECHFLSNLPIMGRALKDTTVYLDNENQIIIESSLRKCLIYENDRWIFKAKLETNDVGFRVEHLENVFIYFLKRQCQVDFVKINGRKCYPSFIEWILLDRFKFNQKRNDKFCIENCYALPGDWHDWKTSVIDLTISLVDYDDKVDHLLVKCQLLKYLFEKLKFPIAFRFHFIDSRLNLLNQNGKLNYRKLLNCVDKLQVPQMFSTESDMKHWMNSLISAVLHIDTTVMANYANEPLSKLGLDSMLALQISLEVEQHLKIFHNDLPYNKLFEVVLKSTLNSLSEWIKKIIFDEPSNTFTLANRKPIDTITISKTNEISYNVAISKNSQLSQMYQIRNECNISTVSIEHRWMYFMEECVDSTPTVIITGEQTIIVIVASHSGLVCAIDYNSIKRTLRWSVQLVNRIEASPIPNSQGNLVYIGDYSGIFYALSTDSGSILWQFSTGDIIKCSPHAFTCEISPNLNEELVLCGSYDHYLYCWHQHNGILKWKVNLNDSAIYSSPVTCSEGSTWFVLASTLDGTIAKLDISTAEIQWKVSLSNCPIFSTPKLLNQHAIIASTDCSLLSISLIDGTIKWNYSTERPIFSSPITIDSARLGEIIVCGTHGPNVIGVHADSGCIRWKQATQSAVFGNVIYCAHINAIAVIDIDGRLYLLEPYTGRYITVKHTNSTNECSDSKNAKMNHFQLPGQVFSSPIYFRNEIFFGSRDNHVYCVRLLG